MNLTCATRLATSFQFFTVEIARSHRIFYSRPFLSKISHLWNFHPISCFAAILNKRIAKSIAIFWFWNCVPYCPFLNPSHSQYSHVTSLHESPCILVALSTCFGSNYLNKMKGTNHWRIKKAGKKQRYGSNDEGWQFNEENMKVIEKNCLHTGLK